MWELRWILVGLGVLVVGGIYLWGRKPLALKLGSIARSRRSGKQPEEGPEEADPSPPARAVSTRPPAMRVREKVVALRFMPRSEEELDSETTVLALRAAGLVHGKYGIFHYRQAESGDPVFSVASLIEPGSFDLTKLKDTTLPGMSFFMVLPGSGDPVTRFDTMVQLARSLAQELNSELFDERGSSWSVQRERYIREEIIEYRHQLNRA